MCRLDKRSAIRYDFETIKSLGMSDDASLIQATGLKQRLRHAHDLDTETLMRSLQALRGLALTLG